MGKLKFFSLILIIGGFLFISYGVWHIIQTNVKTGEAMAYAEEVINEPKEEWLDNEENRFLPPSGEAVGFLNIPKIEGKLPIIEGTNPNDLEKGVGHYKGSYYPGENGQIVLSGHRDTVFRRAGELEIGDRLEVVLPHGEFQYEIVSTKIVEPDDLSIITLQNNEEELVLTTCYPFSYVGNAPQRYIMYAKKV